MVGVASKFRGCITCRRRKKKCSLERPTCSRCNKAGFVCGGYDVPTVFVHTTATAKGVIVARERSDIPLRHSLNLSAYEDQYLSLFWSIYLPNGQPQGTKLAGPFPTGSWISVAKDLSSQYQSVRKSLLALCMILVGQRDKQPWMVHEALQLYISALDEVQTMLKTKSECSDDALLVASRALAAYELLGSLDHVQSSSVSRAKSWHSHNQGQGAILTRRCPEVYMHGRAHQLFADSRVQLSIAALLNNQRCFLAEPDWITIPWTHVPKSPRDHLLDVMVQIPALLEDLEFLTKSGDFADGIIARRLRDEYAKVYSGLRDWEEKYFPHEELENILERQSDDSAANDPMPVHLASCFWTMKLVANNLMRVACLLFPHIDPDPEWVESFSISAQDELCRNVAGVVGVLLHPAAGVFWGQYAMCPVAMCLLHLTSTQQLKSETADKLLNSFSGQINPDALIKFVLALLKEWPDVRSSSLPVATMSAMKFTEVEQLKTQIHVQA